MGERESSGFAMHGLERRLAGPGDGLGQGSCGSRENVSDAAGVMSQWSFVVGGRCHGGDNQR